MGELAELFLSLVTLGILLLTGSEILLKAMISLLSRVDSFHVAVRQGALIYLSTYEQCDC